MFFGRTLWTLWGSSKSPNTLLFIVALLARKVCPLTSVDCVAKAERLLQGCTIWLGDRSLTKVGTRRLTQEITMCRQELLRVWKKRTEGYQKQHLKAANISVCGAGSCRREGKSVIPLSLSVGQKHWEVGREGRLPCSL